MIGRWRFWDVVGGEMGVNVVEYLEGKLGDYLRFYAEVKISKAHHYQITPKHTPINTFKEVQNSPFLGSYLQNFYAW